MRLVFARRPPTDSGTFNYTFFILVKWWVDMMNHSDIGQPSFTTSVCSLALIWIKMTVFNSSQITMKSLQC